MRYGELSWTERPDVPVDDTSKERIEYYYAAVTLHTNAGFRRYENKEMLVGLGLGEGGRFSHETSANLASPDDPRLWSGYSVRELSEDPRLLGLLADQVGDGKPVPGLPTGLGRTDGDGGRPTWELGHVSVPPHPGIRTDPATEVARPCPGTSAAAGAARQAQRRVALLYVGRRV